ncbi:multidrug effflux MFS transporter [Sneathiella chinensis]|uniref:Bcr/CflA family efflux transporter n=1 Tax=Sneathiella chinensis TaxID=349750 RepID=A0ABQ5TYL2_9PROT|nr:multidrug effflux MFS transporter [Sneathiella chinensis]GLQ04909.1 Bcr/CflA family drug resistance efflux transporter [Sneathiella chinensis]
MKLLVPGTVSFTMFLAAAVALGPLATDMYLPSLPTLEKDFSASVFEVQLTLSVFIAGLATFQLVVGPLTDRFGRKPVLIAGLLIFILSSLACTVATSIEQLVVWRFLQSVGVCTGVVIPRAMVRDLFERQDAARELSRMGTIMGLAPAIAPVIGGYIAVFWKWPGIFMVLALYGVILTVVVVFGVEETSPRENRQPLGLGRVFQNYGFLIRHPEFQAYAGVVALCFSGFFAYISNSSFVLIDVFGLPAEQFGYYFGLVVLGFITGTVLGPILTRQAGLKRSLQVGVSFCFLGGALLLLLAFADIRHALAAALPMLLYNMGVGIVMPQSQAGAMSPFPKMAGSAAALAGFLSLGFSGLVGMLLALLFNGTQMPMAWIIFLVGGATIVFFHLTVFRRDP